RRHVGAGLHRIRRRFSDLRGLTVWNDRQRKSGNVDRAVDEGEISAAARLLGRSSARLIGELGERWVERQRDRTSRRGRRRKREQEMRDLVSGRRRVQRERNLVGSLIERHEQ